MPNALEVFCSYAHKDESLLEELKKHLSRLQSEGLISLWCDSLVVAGRDRKETIDAHLETASLILLLVSADFLASNSCYEVEMQRAIQRHQANVARVIPIIVRPCDWTHAPFALLQCLPRNGEPITKWSDRDSAWTDVAFGIRRAVEELLQLAVSVPRIALSPVWNVPYPRNPFFTGRDDVLVDLERQFQASHSQPQAISGLGGVGKTQVAIEYAYKHRQKYQAVLWANASSEETLVSDYIAIAGRLNLPEKDAQDQSLAVQAVKEWLQSHRQWLLILDNADELALASKFLPTDINGHVLLTTQAQARGRRANQIKIETFSSEQGMLFLLQRAALLAPDAPLEQIDIEDRQLATQIMQELGGLPLALDQAGAYLEETGCSLEHYLDIYRRHRIELLNERRDGQVDDHPEPVASTFLLSFKKVEQKNPAAADLLRLCAFLYPDAIPQEIIRQEGAELGSRLAPIVGDTYLFNRALEALRAYSLIRSNQVNGTFSLHRLVQAVLRDSLSSEERKQWMQRAVSAVSCAFPDIEFEEWASCKRCLPHALISALWIEQEHMTFPEATRLLNQTASYLYTRGQYAEAEPLYQLALAIDEEQLGANHPATATSLNNLALLYKTLGRYAEAELLYLRVLAIDEEQPEADHSDMATSLNNLAALYCEQENYEEAEPLFQKALAICEQRLGTDHPDTATSLNNLAELYRAQKRYADADPLYRRALEICEQRGADHPDTARCLNNLAQLYRAQGKYAEAEPLYLRALAIRKQRLGTDHPDTARSLNNLAELYRAQGKYAEAEPLYLRALAIRKQRLGANHPETVRSLNNLAELYRAQGKYVEAELLYQEHWQLGSNG